MILRPHIAIALGLLLAGAATSAHAVDAPCFVQVVYTDANGHADPDMHDHARPCRAGEHNGDFETYNPYTGVSTYYGHVPNPDAFFGTGGHDQPGTGGSSGVPLVSLSDGGGTGSGQSSGGTSNCTPAPRGGTKIKSPTTQSPGAKPTCHTASSTSAAH